ncbi:Gfo/Idh/MocA family oxidoreductase [Geodermatophilus sp. YIM 151500]|uniref:Gfo/Idh/MocA family protein n=1 Tax=Geodermatophilus sp. YIM 151500 TaxID=2984531 RepID=UPI0021E49584|nr:Gfo/Idh/MocA family oxidoreductase [Geodermatophilus sp. YIM 151500]MCV2488522.1 Gfo/Idh/MocA family oxidoreductase [Geodermatophilus sp. YIM 151500]
MRFAVLGTGFWARAVHAASLAQHPDAELIGIWGRDATKAAVAGEEFGVPGTTDLQSLLDEVDAVSIAVPPDVQASLAVTAASAGRHLLLEKPIALTVPDADRVVEAVASAGVASVVFFTFRFQAATSTWLTEAGRSRLAGGAGSWLSSLAGTPFGDSPWRGRHGALWDIGPHALSLLVPALGRVTAVQAGAGRGDTVHLVLTHASGAASTVTVTHAAAPLSEGVEFFVHGDTGRLTLLPDTASPREAHRAAVDELRAAALTGGAHPCDAAFARDVTVVLAAAQRALASGCREPVPS